MDLSTPPLYEESGDHFRDHLSWRGHSPTRSFTTELPSEEKGYVRFPVRSSAHSTYESCIPQAYLQHSPTLPRHAAPLHRTAFPPPLPLVATRAPGIPPSPRGQSPAATGWQVPARP